MPPLKNHFDKWDDCDITSMIMMIIKQKGFKCVKCINKRYEFYDVPTCYTKFLKYDPY
jgi:hypothetical protein